MKPNVFELEVVPVKSELEVKRGEALFGSMFASMKTDVKEAQKNAVYRTRTGAGSSVAMYKQTCCCPHARPRTVETMLLLWGSFSTY